MYILNLIHISCKQRPLTEPVPDGVY